MHKLIDNFYRELKKYENHDDLTMSEFEIVSKLASTLKDLQMISEDGSYSHDGGDWEARGSYRNDSMMPGTSQRRQRRDSRGRYSREGGGSYREGGYSYDDGMEELNELLEDLEKGADERTRNAIHRFKQEIRR